MKFPAIVSLRLPEELVSSFESTLKFVYEGKIILNKYNVFRYLVLSDLFSCQNLKAACTEYICQCMKVTFNNSSYHLGCLCPKCETGSHDYRMIVSDPQTIKTVYTVNEMYKVWSCMSDEVVREATTIWFASTLSKADHLKWTVEGFELSQLKLIKYLHYWIVMSMECLSTDTLYLFNIGSQVTRPMIKML